MNKQNQTVQKPNKFDTVFSKSTLDYNDIVYRNASCSTLILPESVCHSTPKFITGDSTRHCILNEKVGRAPLILKQRQALVTFRLYISERKHDIIH